MSVNFDELRRHFRKETGKLTNYIWHPLRITDFTRMGPDFYEEFKDLNRQRRTGEISGDKWHRLTGDLLRKHQRRGI